LPPSRWHCHLHGGIATFTVVRGGRENSGKSSFALGLSSRLSALPLTYAAAGGWRNSPQGGSHGCEPVWRQGRMPCRQTPQPARVPSGQSPEGAASGCSFFWLLFSTPGILPSALRAGFAVRTRSCACVSKQRKVTRPPAGGRKPAAGEHAGRDATVRRHRNWMTSFAVEKCLLPRWDDEQKNAAPCDDARLIPRHREGGNTPVLSLEGRGSQQSALCQLEPTPAKPRPKQKKSRPFQSGFARLPSHAKLSP
jgi:hypothetical protein